MHKQHFLVPVALLAAFGLAACENNTESGQQAATERDTGDDIAALGEMESMGEAEGESVALTVEQSPEYGEHLAADDGRAVYMLEADAAGRSSCNDACAEAWPPVLADGEPEAADPDVQDDLLGTIQREDGSMQVTYDGHPLYYYSEDAGPGEAQGQDVSDQWGEWYLVSVEGEKIEGLREASQTQGASRT